MLLMHNALAAEQNSVTGTPPAKPRGPSCNRATFTTVIDVGHTAEAPGALSARGVYEYEFNLRLAKQIEKGLRVAGFERTVLMITAGMDRAGLFMRAVRANELAADLFLSIHHDAVPERFLETWQFEGQERHFSDRFPGHSIFISNNNADHDGSLLFARLLGNALKAQGMQYASHYTEEFMGDRRRELVDAHAGVYLYNELIVLKETHMPAVLLEAGSIVNRREELLLATPERQAIISAAVVAAVESFCGRQDQ